MLVYVGRQPELGEGQKLIKEVAGRKLLLTRHRGEVYAMDAHCYHMGHPLENGDLEDVADVHPCIVCPAHRHRINLKTGQRVEKDLCGNACGGQDQQQRIYQVFADNEKIQVYIPDAPQLEAPLPSDKYNFWAVEQQVKSTPPRRNMGLFGMADSEPSTPGSLEPYAGINLSQSPPKDPKVAAQQQQQHVPARGQAQRTLNFRAMKARQAIFAKSYVPPLAEPPQPRGLGVAVDSQTARSITSQQQPAVVHRGLGKQTPAGQRTLQQMWGSQQVAATETGPSEMDMD